MPVYIWKGWDISSHAAINKDRDKMRFRTSGKLCWERKTSAFDHRSDRLAHLVRVLVFWSKGTGGARDVPYFLHKIEGKAFLTFLFS